MADGLTNESLPDQALRDHAGLVMRQVSIVCDISVLDYRVNDAAQEEVLTEGGWRRVSELLNNAGKKP